MLDKTGFNKWAGTYDEHIENSSKGYPFEGYYDVLGYIQNAIKIDHTTKILDLGIGTGLLTNDLYNRGAQIFGVDFSDEMIVQAKVKMPKAVFMRYDFNDAVPEGILKERFDYIVSSYPIHHVKDDRKVELIKELMSCLKDNGKILFADVAFETMEAQEIVKNSTDEWDEEEHYMVAQQIIEMLASAQINADYQQLSMCAGVLEINKK